MMHKLLEPAIEFGLDIYDRNYGTPQAKHYRFPDRYQPYVRGALPYNEMVKAYRRYKVFLNVNTVSDSPTMFSRRVFELLACGTPVVSSRARGIEEVLGEGVVCLAKSAQDVHNHLEMLLNNPRAWNDLSRAGRNTVSASHTYKLRLGEIVSKS